MAKKNKKSTKINIKIRNFFGGDPFDVGIERVGEKTLIELAHTIGLYDVEFTKKELLRALRQLWSTGDMTVREDILHFFIEDKILYPPLAPAEPSMEKEEKIESLLEEFKDITPEERVELFGIFLDVRTKKISYAKIESKLQHLRFEKKKQRLQKALEGTFDLEDRLEFNASVAITFKEQSFKKITVLKTAMIDIDELMQKDEESLIKKISSLKQRTADKKQKDVDEFVKNLKQPHPYLSDEQILNALKTANPTADLKLPPLNKNVLKAVLKANADVSDLYVSEADVVLITDAKFVFNELDKSIDYEVHTTIELQKILKNIWRGEKFSLDRLIKKARTEQEEDFRSEFNLLVEECQKASTLLLLPRAELLEMVYEHLFIYLDNTLSISPKTQRKIIYAFNKSIQEQLLKRQRQMLLARTIRDFKNLFPLARSMKRELILHIGPTNSGKTYEALKVLKNADTGYYLAPLRLLALEGYEDLNASGVDASLITGEEQLINEEATHISSTIEMLNFDVDVDVCVIDEVQMIDDRDRGWAWANAIIGAPAKKIIMTGSVNAKEAIIELAKYLGEKLTIVEFERKNPLKLLTTATAIADVRPATAIIAFSRKDVLRLKQNFSRNFKVSVVYGNLSPEVRREEARRFREKETDILIATDAIAMGMNLPIKTILFSKVVKFDGEKDRFLTPSEVHQIAGRAGRYGLNEIGYVGALKNDALHVIEKNMSKPAKEVDIPFKVMANLDHIRLVGSILEENSLAKILEFFVENMKFDGPFTAENIETMLEAAKIVDGYNLDIAEKYHLASAPLTLKSPYIMASFERYVHKLEQREPIYYLPPELKSEFASTMDELLEIEDRVKEITLYLWLSYRFEDFFVDADNARHFRGVLNRYIENSLKNSHFVPRCKLCTKPLPLNSNYGICQSCFRKNYKHKSSKR
ncbi:helicase-related protein [Sulfurimonas sp. HSL-1716]|uniref:helicase-related protein n=1 Tax=Hydrocurvibacter sulfurireducens TaxID=3131937 RepID=UPI0031F8BB53